MNNKKIGIPMVFIVMLTVQLSCKVTERPYPVSLPTAIFAEVPKLLTRGEKHQFSIQATPGVECHAGIGYYNMKDKWIFVELAMMESDQDGICEWTWEIPEDAKDGLGEFRGYIQEGDQSNNIFPANFCIERCP